MSFRRPHTITLRARFPPLAINTVFRELTEVSLNSQIVGIQRIRQAEWCATFRSKEFADLAKNAFDEAEGRELISETLRVNEQGTCRLEGVPIEYGNENIYKRIFSGFDNKRRNA